MRFTGTKYTHEPFNPHKLRPGQKVKISQGEGSGRQGILGSINSSTGETVVHSGLIHMMTHIDHLEPINEDTEVNEHKCSIKSLKEFMKK